MQAIVFVDKFFWLASLPQTKTPKPEISAPQAVCDVVIAAPPKLFRTDSKLFEQIPIRSGFSRVTRTSSGLS